MLSQDAIGKTEISYAFAGRADGSIRQLVVQDGMGNLIDMGYFEPGTSKEDAVSMMGRKYHWAASFTDAELIEHYHLTPERIKDIRDEEIAANESKIFTHMSDKDRNQ